MFSMKMVNIQLVDTIISVTESGHKLKSRTDTVVGTALAFIKEYPNEVKSSGGTVRILSKDPHPGRVE